MLKEDQLVQVQELVVVERVKMMVIQQAQVVMVVDWYNYLLLQQ